MTRLLLILLLALPTAAAPPQRIVSLSPHTSEMAAALGLEGQLVAVSDYSNYPPSLSKLPSVAGYAGIQVERVLAHQPDLVLAWKGGNPAPALAQLQALGAPLFYSNPHTPEQLLEELLALGSLTERQAQAEALVASLRQRLARLDQTYGGRPPRLLFYQLWSQPLMTSGSSGWLQPLLARCSAKSVFDDLTSPYPQVDAEMVLARDPPLIIIGDGDPDYWQRWPALQAVRQQRVVPLSPDLLQRMGPRIIDGLEQLCATVWPELETTENMQ